IKKGLGTCGDGHIEEQRSGAISESLRAGTGSLRGSDEPHDTGEGRVVSDGGDSHAETSATVPAMTLAPWFFVTAFDSPVIIDSSTSAPPSTTSPSAGTRVPGRIRTISPGRNWDTGTVWTSEPLMRSAVSGNKAPSALSAPRACAIARISSQCPRTM